MSTRRKTLTRKMLVAAAKEMAAKDKDPKRHWTERVLDRENQRNYAEAIKRQLKIG